MDYKEHIENAITYIETNLKSDTNLADLARVAGYSEYHFLRVFKEVTRLTTGHGIIFLKSGCPGANTSVRQIMDINLKLMWKQAGHTARIFIYRLR